MKRDREIGRAIIPGAEKPAAEGDSSSGMEEVTDEKDKGSREDLEAGQGNLGEKCDELER